MLHNCWAMLVAEELPAIKPGFSKATVATGVSLLLSNEKQTQAASTASSGHAATPQNTGKGDKRPPPWGECVSALLGEEAKLLHVTRSSVHLFEWRLEYLPGEAALQEPGDRLQELHHAAAIPNLFSKTTEVQSRTENVVGMLLGSGCPFGQRDLQFADVAVAKVLLIVVARADLPPRDLPPEGLLGKICHRSEIVGGHSLMMDVDPDHVARRFESAVRMQVLEFFNQRPVIINAGLGAGLAGAFGAGRLMFLTLVFFERGRRRLYERGHRVRVRISF